MRSHLFILSFMSLALGDMSVRMLLHGMSEISLPMFSSRTFMVLQPSLYSQLIFDKGGRRIKWSKNSLQQMVLGDLNSYMQKNETRSPTYTIHKNKFKVDKRLKYKILLLILISGLLSPSSKPQQMPFFIPERSAYFPPHNQDPFLLYNFPPP